MAEVFTRLSSRAFALGLGAVLLVAGCSLGGSSTTSSGASSTDVTVWTAWGGQELTAYQKVLKPFQDSTGIKVHLITIRDSATQLSINVAAGTSPPDNPPGPTLDKIPDWAKKRSIKPPPTPPQNQQTPPPPHTPPTP